MALLSKWKDEDEAIEITKNQDNDEPDWKAVGSRRGSLSVRVDNGNNCNNSPFLFDQNERRPSIDNKQWVSFGGFQWEGPSIFDDDNSNHTTMPTPLAPTTINNNNDIYDPAFSSVPVAPSSPIESPIMIYNKQQKQRSTSFFIGQSYHPFHNNGVDVDLERYYKNALTPTVEEEEEQEEKNDGVLFDGDVRTRSQSSSSSNWMNHHYHYQQQYQRFEKRRPSLGFIPSSSSSSSSSSSFLPELSTTNNSLLFQRRMSQPGAVTNYTFPDIPNGTSPANSFLGISSGAHHLSDRLENINLSKSTPSRKYSSTTNETFNGSEDNNSSVGKGILLQRSDHATPIFSVEFKSGRTDFYYYQQHYNSNLNLGDLVIVEADRGKDIGKIASERLTVEQVMRQKKKKDEFIIENEMHVKRIYRQATPDEVGFLLTKKQDEQQALEVCLQKIKNRKLPMDVVDAEYQWDRRKLTFYFTAERRIDFRELVRELFKIYKTRIWMCSVNGNLSENQNDA